MSPSRLLLASAVSLSILSPNLASAACQAYRILPKFSVNQSNGIPVIFSLRASRSGEVNGSAHYTAGSDFTRTVGEIEDGTFDGRVIKFRVVWSGGGSAIYEGHISGDGLLHGSARWGANRATFDSIQKFLCAPSES